MAVSVIFRVPSPVQIIIHAIYKVENAWSVNTGCMAVTVTCRVQQTVKTTYVTYRMEHALHVSQDGPVCIVEQVRIQQEKVVNN